MNDIIVPVASYVEDDLASLAAALCVTVDELAAYFFAREVVHTSNR